MLDQIMIYIGENTKLTAITAGIVVLLLLLLILFQVTRMKREVHKICKKIQKYFDVILTEEEPREEPVKEQEPDAQLPVYQTTDEWKKQQEKQKDAEDAKLLMEVISEVF